MARYTDVDALLSKYGEKHFNGEITSEEYYAIKIPLDYAPTAEVVSKEKYDELNERYHRLLESAKILSDAVREYERREDG